MRSTELFNTPTVNNVADPSSVFSTLANLEPAMTLPFEISIDAFSKVILIGIEPKIFFLDIEPETIMKDGKRELRTVLLSPANEQ